MLLEMGSLTSRQNIGVEEVDIPSSSVYRYPPKSGKQSNNRSGCRRRGAREPFSVAPGASVLPGHRVGSLEALHHLFHPAPPYQDYLYTHFMGENLKFTLDLSSLDSFQNCIVVTRRF